MVNRSKRQYIGFLLSMIAITVWSWFVSQELRLFYSQAQDSGYNYNQIWLRGPNFFFNFQPLFDRLSSFSHVGAIVLIGTCFIFFPQPTCRKVMGVTG